MILEGSLIASLLVNILFFLYSRWLIKIIKTTEEDIDGVSNLISQYVSHVNSVHEMEMFYGDPTLGSLIKHGKEIVEKIDTLDYVVLEQRPEDIALQQEESDSDVI